jgi:ABC-type transport system involved in cytochrome bd biosynthesis fused ATPase/permease subunit
MKLLISAIVAIPLFVAGMSFKDRMTQTPKRTTFELAVFSACNAVRKMEMFPTVESKQEADHAISRIEAVVQTHTEQEIADNMTFVLRSYQSAIEKFNKDPSEKNLAALRNLEHDIDEIRELVRPQ